MVFVTVGNAVQGFRRLLDAVDQLAAQGVYGSERVFLQTGNNPGFIPKHCEAKDFIPMDEFNWLMEKADLIICHGGCTQLQAVRLGKVPIVMPRRRKYDEHVNDHQLQLVEVLAKEGRIVPAYEPVDLPGAIAEARRIYKLFSAPPRSKMVSLVARAIEDLIGKA